MEKSIETLREEDLADNPEKRLAVCLCLDCSGSMQGEPIDKLNEGIRLFYDAIGKDDKARYAAEVGIVSFGGGATIEQKIGRPDYMGERPVLQAMGGTPMGEAVNLALDMLEECKEEYKKNAVAYYQPWLILMSDGQPNGSPEELGRALSRVRDLTKGSKLTVMSICIGSDGKSVMDSFAPDGKSHDLDGFKFEDFFTWLSQSVSSISSSAPDAKKISLPPSSNWEVAL